MDDTKTQPAGLPAVTGGASEEELAEALVAQAREQGLELTGRNGLLTGLTKRVLETALETEMAAELRCQWTGPSPVTWYRVGILCGGTWRHSSW